MTKSEMIKRGLELNKIMVTMGKGISDEYFKKAFDNRRKNNISVGGNSAILASGLKKSIIEFEYNLIVEAYTEFINVPQCKSDCKYFKTYQNEYTRNFCNNCTNCSLYETNKRNKFEVGQILYNHGDGLNASGWYEIVNILDEDGFAVHYDIREIGDKMRTSRIIENIISTIDKNNGLTRIVTKEARIEYLHKTFGIDVMTGKNDEVCKNLTNELENTIEELKRRQAEKTEILKTLVPESADYKRFKDMYLSEIKEELQEKELKINAENHRNKNLEEQKEKAIIELQKYLLLTDNNLDYEKCRLLAEKTLRRLGN
ncbi:MAG: hypothetical protein PHF86_12305 [Candidatus Nanoarchaeia archaeon]|nr:hypothetical protein [Candidatus Nanoarchaeia archaeon]